MTSAGEDLPPEVVAIRSLKTTQYSYCGLPIVARKDLVIDRASVFGYDVRSPSSVRDALLAAKAAGKDLRLGDSVRSWDDLAIDLLGDHANGAHAFEPIVEPMPEEAARCAS